MLEPYQVAFVLRSSSVEKLNKIPLDSTGTLLQSIDFEMPVKTKGRGWMCAMIEAASFRQNMSDYNSR